MMLGPAATAMLPAVEHVGHGDAFQFWLVLKIGTVAPVTASAAAGAALFAKDHEARDRRERPPP